MQKEQERKIQIRKIWQFLWYQSYHDLEKTNKRTNERRKTKNGACFFNTKLDIYIIIFTRQC